MTLKRRLLAVLCYCGIHNPAYSYDRGDRRFYADCRWCGQRSEIEWIKRR